MREILFRGKRIDNGEWVYGYVFDDGMADNKQVFVGGLTVSDAKRNTCDRYEVGLDFEEVDPTTIGQYTGLADKNGAKIFEGDVVLVNWFGDNGKFVVGYEGGSFFPYQIGCKFNFNSLWDVWSQDYDGTIMEVIGNIHDNPDLLNCCDNG